MEVFSLFASIGSLLGVFVIGIFVRNYFSAYAAEKAKNLASKEDISRLTHLVEEVKAEYLFLLEKHKAEIVSEGQVLERRRKAYEEICSALRVFIAGHTKNEDAKERFHIAYASSWLWASEEVLSSLNSFIEMQVQHAAVPGSIAQADLKLSYAAVLVGMRKDVGFPSTRMASTAYKFVQF